jgi:hypothetical protein
VIGLANRKTKHLDVWQYRREFLEAAQRKMPEIGRYLRLYGMRAQDHHLRSQVIRDWQNHFRLPYGWAFECAWATLAMWDRSPDVRQSLQWFAAPRSRNLAEEGIPTFKFQGERQFYPSLDFGWFKQSIHGALEIELERFGKSVGAEDLGKRRHPKELRRAYECWALRVIKGLSPEQIFSLPEYSRDWTTLSRDMKAAADLAGLRPPRRGRPTKNIAR